MKQLLFTIFFTAFLMLSACISISSEVKMACRCLGNMSEAASKTNRVDVDEEADNEDRDSQTSTLLPVNSWNAKMMIW